MRFLSFPTFFLLISGCHQVPKEDFKFRPFSHIALEVLYHHLIQGIRFWKTSFTKHLVLLPIQRLGIVTTGLQFQLVWRHHFKWWAAQLKLVFGRNLYRATLGVTPVYVFFLQIQRTALFNRFWTTSKGSLFLPRFTLHHVKLVLAIQFKCNVGTHGICFIVTEVLRIRIPWVSTMVQIGVNNFTNVFLH